jgi:Spy/CpxP family protein refolding chaperone
MKNNGKRSLTCILIALFVLVAVPVLGAQDKPDQDKTREHRDRMDKLRERLDLTDEQEEQLRPVMMDNAKELRELRQQSEGGEPSKESAKATREKLHEMMKAHREKIAAILTPEQMTEFDKLQQEWAQHMRQKGQERKGGGGPDRGSEKDSDG